MKRQAAFVLGTWFGCGLSPVAPGTVGTIGALPVYLLVRDLVPRHGTLVLLAAALALTLAGVWAAGIVADVSGKHDPQIVVVDEVAGVLVALAAASRSTASIVLAVVLFRLFDITKPFPARAAERLPGGWGIVLDDIAAGVWAAAVLLALRSGGVLP